jgi:hypothetical protein
MNDDNDELVRATRDAQEARTLLLNITRAMRNSIDRDRVVIEEDVLMPWVDAQIDLENAINQYAAMHERWVAQIQ